MYPISNYASQIINSIRSNHVTIIVGETGCGKSTQIMPILDQHVRSIVVTQPRRLAAISLAKRVADEQKWSMPGKLGYITGVDKFISPTTSRIFCTDGVEVARTLCSKFRPEVLVLDEIHEMNMNMETLMAYQKREIAQGCQTRLVLMSATMNAERLSKYFWNAPIINVEGRQHTVTDVTKDFNSTMQFVNRCIQERRSVLVFVPGKAEIDEFIRDDLGHYYDPDRPHESQIEVHRLHGEMCYEEQLPAFQPSKKAKFVVATNVAQTSITIPDIDAVLDFQLERTLRLSSGAESLEMQRISKACVLQRMGRAGRVKPGLYFNALDGNPNWSDSFQLDFPIPEIQRLSLDKIMLRLLDSGIDPVDMEFLHDPGHLSLMQTKDLLYHLGAITRQGKVTTIGKHMLKYPLDARASRMMHEAKTQNIPGIMSIILACVQVGGIYDQRLDRYDETPTKYTGDLEMQLDLFYKARGYSSSNPCPFEDFHINRKSFFQAVQIYKKIIKELWLTDEDLAEEQMLSIEDQHQRIRRSFLSGMKDNLIYRDDERNVFIYPKDNETRSVNNKSVFHRVQWLKENRGVRFLVGVPYNLMVVNKRTGLPFAIPLINWPVPVTLKDIQEVFPDLNVREEFELIQEYNWEPSVSIKSKLIVDGQVFEKMLNHNGHIVFGIAERKHLKELCASHPALQGMYEKAHALLMDAVIKKITTSMKCYIGLPMFTDHLESWITLYSYNNEEGKRVRPVSAAMICELLNVNLKGLKIKKEATEEQKQEPVSLVVDLKSAAQSRPQDSMAINMVEMLRKAAGSDIVEFQPVKKTELVLPDPKQIKKANSSWVSLGKRNYRCPCGIAHRHGKNDSVIICGCGATYYVNK